MAAANSCVSRRYTFVTLDIVENQRRIRRAPAAASVSNRVIVTTTSLPFKMVPKGVI